ncbi:replication initiator protein [Capybara microvirus Cap1_SP_50]|nr:replication initiator protein [Apis mellifera associated microvirus 55]QCS35924.1 replication initiator protein [Capybara microvirus Cap1_SP_50]
MSCYKPISCFTNAKEVDPNLSKIRNTFDCGRCFSCLEAKAKSLALRGYFQWQDTIQQGGFVLFPTYTYNDDHLPWFSMIDKKLHLGVIDSKNLPETCIPCFDWRVFHRLPDLEHDPELKDLGFSYIVNDRPITEKMKEILKYEFGVTGIKYCVGPEYGPDLRYTRRPHFHVVWFFPPLPEGSEHTQEEYINRCVELCISLWEDRGYGYASWSKEGAVVNSDHALKYISKDIVKSIIDWSTHNLESWLDPTLDKKMFKERFVQIQPYMPIPFHSHGFGKYMVDYLESLSIDEANKILHKGYQIPGDFNKYTGKPIITPVPRYVYQKYCYKMDTKQNKVAVTERGDTYFRYHIPLLWKESKAKWLDRFNLINLIQKLDSDVLKHIADNETYCAFFNKNDLKQSVFDSLQSIKAKYTLDHVLAYSAIRGCAASDELYHLFNADDASPFVDLFQEYQYMKLTNIRPAPDSDKESWIDRYCLQKIEHRKLIYRGETGRPKCWKTYKGWKPMSLYDEVIELYEEYDFSKMPLRDFCIPELDFLLYVVNTIERVTANNRMIELRNLRRAKNHSKHDVYKRLYHGHPLNYRSIPK